MDLKWTAAIGLLSAVATAAMMPDRGQRPGPRDDREPHGEYSQAYDDDYAADRDWEESLSHAYAQRGPERGPGPRPDFDRGPGPGRGPEARFHDDRGPGGPPHGGPRHEMGQRDDRGPGGPPPGGPRGPRHEMSQRDDRGPGGPPPHGPRHEMHDRDDRGPGGPPPGGPRGPRHEMSQRDERGPGGPPHRGPHGPQGDFGPPRGDRFEHGREERGHRPEPRHEDRFAHHSERDHRGDHRGPPPSHFGHDRRPEPPRFADRGQRDDHRGPRHEGRGRDDDRGFGRGRPPFGPPMMARFRGGMGPRGHFGPPPFARGPMGGGMPFGPGGQRGQGPQGFGGPGHGPNPMAMLDGDHDGKISKEEVLKHFAEIDANHDDSVTAEELQNHLRAHRPEGGPGRGPQAGPPRGEHRPGPPHRPGHPGPDAPKKPDAPKEPDTKPQKSDEPAKADDAAAKQAEAEFAPADAMSVIPAA